jgi:hypothetical protein
VYILYDSCSIPGCVCTLERRTQHGHTPRPMPQTCRAYVYTLAHRCVHSDRRPYLSQPSLALSESSSICRDTDCGFEHGPRKALRGDAASAPLQHGHARWQNAVCLAAARKVSGWPKRYKLAHAFLWQYSHKKLKSAQLLGQVGVFLTCHFD